MELKETVKDTQDSQKTSTEERIAFKVIVVGESQVGKTCLINRYLVGEFSNNFKSTVGVDFGLKVVEKNGKKMVIQLWDIAGQERFISMTRVYYVQAKGGFVVYDVTNPATKESAIKWKIDIDQKCTLENGKPIPVYLLINKIDLVQNKEAFDGHEDIDQFCKDHGFVGWYITSAKEDIGIKQAVEDLLELMVNNSLNPDNSPVAVASNENNSVRLVPESNNDEENSSCKC